MARACFEIVVEILHGEGGAHSKEFASELRSLYERYARLKGLAVELLNAGEGHFVLKVSGQGAAQAFKGEAGKHCVQSFRSGRPQTSFANVAVLPLPPVGQSRPLDDRDIEVICQTGKQKAGGQNCNKVASAVRMKHIPTGTTVMINGRDQGQNKQLALRVLTARVNELRMNAEAAEYAGQKASQLGERGRGGKARTYNLIENYVLDHRTGKRTNNVKAVMKGQLSLICE